MPRLIERWREISESRSAVPADEDTPLLQDAGDPVVELSRRYPGLSREIAEYLAR
jgi:hypothetical protein